MPVQVSATACWPCPEGEGLIMAVRWVNESSCRAPCGKRCIDSHRC